MNSKTLAILKSVGCFAFAIALILFGTVTYVKDNSIKINGRQTEAVITDISFGYTENGYKDYDISINYTVEGQNYTAEIDDYTSDMQIGGTVNVYYDENNPRSVTTGKYLITTPLITGIAGIILLLAGLVFAAEAKKNKYSCDDKDCGA